MRTSPLALLAASLLSCTMMLESGCKHAAPPAPAQVGVRNSDGSITNPDGSVTYPAGVVPPGTVTQQAAVPNQVGTGPSGPVTQTGTAPMARPTEGETSGATSGPAPVEQAPPAPVRLTVPAGAPVTVRVTETLAASRNDVGDRFTGVLDRPLVSHGATVFAAGTPVSGEVVASKGKGRFKGAGDLGIELTAIGRERVATSEYEKIGKGRGKRTGGFAAGGGGLGAIIGGIAGGGKGALIGGLAGAGAGTAAGAYTGSRDVVIPSESIVTFRLRESLTR